MLISLSGIVSAYNEIASIWNAEHISFVSELLGIQIESRLSVESRSRPVPTASGHDRSRPVPTGTDRNLLEIKNRGGFLFVLKCGSSAKKKFNEYEFALSVGTCTSRHIIINFIVLCRVCTRIIVGCVEKRRKSHPPGSTAFFFCIAALWI